MKTQVKTFSDIDKCIGEIEYYIQHGDIDRMYSNRGMILEQARALMEPCYTHLWMIMYPLEGQENTIPTYISDLSEWLVQIATKCRGRIPMNDVYVELADKYLIHVRSELQKNHGYPNLKGHLGQDISMAMNDIFATIQHDILVGRKKDKHYMISKQKAQELIKWVLDIK